MRAQNRSFNLGEKTLYFRMDMVELFPVLVRMILVSVLVGIVTIKMRYLVDSYGVLCKL